MGGSPVWIRKGRFGKVEFISTAYLGQGALRQEQLALPSPVCADGGSPSCPPAV